MAANVPPEGQPQPPLLQQGAPLPPAGDAPAAYVYLTGNATANEGSTEEEMLLQILHWIGFRSAVQKNALSQDAFESFDFLKVLTEKDITAMASDFSSRTVANGRINFGTMRTKRLKALIHWIQDFYRVSCVPSIVGLSEISFKAELETALTRNEIRKNQRELTKTATDAASPGPLESEKQWKEWSEKFINYLGLHLGVSGVPLSSVVRENQAPALDKDFSDFISKTVACAPLEGEFFDADKLAVFNMIVSFTTGQPSGDWIKATLKYSDGRKSFMALSDHFAGEGNATRNMAEATRLRDSLHYKSERAMPFETFLTKCQKMHNIFEEEDEPMCDAAKTRFLFEKVQHPELKSAIEALKAQQTSGNVITYTMAANHLATAVSQLPEVIARNRSISALGTNGASKGQENGEGIYNADGSIKTGFISNWNSLSKADKNKVFAERKRTKGKIPGTNANDGKNKDSLPPAVTNRIKQLVEQSKKYKRQVQALKRTKPGDTNNDASDEDLDAGDQFGGKVTKKAKK